MDIITAETMESLVRRDGEPCVSVYMPTHRAGRETQQGPIRLRNLLDKALEDLVDTGMRRPEAQALLSPGGDLADDHDFWQHQEDGLAVFIAPDRTDTFRLPVSFDDLVVVGSDFYVKPLWPVVSGGDVFHLLALSRNEVRLLWADRYRVGEVDLPDDVPTSLAEALWFDDPEKQLQLHGAGRAGRGRVVATFHGHGVPDERSDAKLEVFLRAVDAGLRHLIDADEPLVLAGVEDIAARFRSVSRHPRIVDEIVSGNPDALEPAELHARAVEIMRPRIDRRVESDAEAVLAGGERAVTDVAEAVSAALVGRVEILFLPMEARVWGTADPDGTNVEIGEGRSPENRELLDLAGVATWSTGGRVHAVSDDEVPGDGLVAALLRY